MKDKWPAAHKFLKAFRLTNSQQEPIMKAVDVDNKNWKTLLLHGSMPMCLFGNPGLKAQCSLSFI